MLYNGELWVLGRWRQEARELGKAVSVAQLALGWERDSVEVGWTKNPRMPSFG